MICSICLTDKESDLFPKTPTGFRSYCKVCYTVKKREARRDPERRAVHNKACREWAASNKEKTKCIKKKWSLSNPDKVREAKRTWSINNPGVEASYCAHRRATKKNATPSWFDRSEVQYIYKLAKERGLVVDHIVPLNSDLVCGLHVQDNLRCISAELNCRKGNTYWPDMPK